MTSSPSLPDVNALLHGNDDDDESGDGQDEEEFSSRHAPTLIGHRLLTSTP
jgi:hypothetical protein